MKVVEKLKLNRFREVAIPKNCDYFARLQGNLSEPPSAAYSGDDSVRSGMSKIETLMEGEKVLMNEVRRKAAEERDSAQKREEEKKMIR